MLNRDKAITDVRAWVKNSLEKSEKIALGLRYHGKTLRKRWQRKFTSSKQQHIKLINDVHASLAKQCGGEDDKKDKSNWYTRHEPFGKNARSGMLTLGLDPDSLIEEPDNLFRQLEARSKHPAQLFYTDFHCANSASNDGLIKQYFVPGTFNITAQDYGAWQEWSDEKVHSFQTVAASVAFLVFESQSEILNALWEIFDRLSYGLSLPVEGLTPQDAEDQQETLEPIPLVTFIDAPSLYVRFPGRKFSLQDVYQICSDQLSYASAELTTLRKSRMAFDRRTKASKEIHKAAGSCVRFIAYQVLVEPHERVLWWLFIVEEAQTLSGDFRQWKEMRTATSHLHYIESFKSFVATIRRRSDHLLRNILAQDLDDALPGSIMPLSLTRTFADIDKFLVHYAFAEPWWKTRIANRISYHGALKPVLKDLPYVHTLVQEWAEEALLITRIQEVLMACEPTILLHHMEPLNQQDRARNKLCPPAPSYPHETKMRERSAPLARFFFPGAGEQSGEAASTPGLSAIWETYQQNSLYFYEKEGFRQEWLEKVEDVWIRTDPGEAIDNKRKPERRRQRKETPTTPTFETRIPHQIGEERPSARKLTLRTRTRLNPGICDETPSTPPALEERAQPAELEEVPLQMSVSQASFNVIEALFSNAQVNAQSIRWQTFSNFMRDAGCDISLNQSGGVSTRFVWTDPRDDKQKTMTFHRPHPVPILEPQMLRNAHTAIRNTFGWKKEDFVPRRG